MTTDCKALCAELLEIIDLLCEGDARPDCDIVARARAYLSQSEPEEPTDEELMALAVTVFDNPFSTDKDYARAVLARWGRPAVEPVPVSERLPGEGDCDPSFQCWWFTPSEEKWILWPIKWAGPECSHWLPHYALPVPTTTETP